MNGFSTFILPSLGRMMQQKDHAPRQYWKIYMAPYCNTECHPCIGCVSWRTLRDMLDGVLVICWTWFQALLRIMSDALGTLWRLQQVLGIRTYNPHHDVLYKSCFILSQDSVGSGVIPHVTALSPGVEPSCILAAQFPMDPGSSRQVLQFITCDASLGRLSGWKLDSATSKPSS